MCFYDQHLIACGDYRWGHFREHCSKEYRPGETCGTKLVMKTIISSEKCKICTKIDTKKNQIKKEEQKILRWKNEHGTRREAFERTEYEIKMYGKEIDNLEYERHERRAAYLRRGDGKGEVSFATSSPTHMLSGAGAIPVASMNSTVLAREPSAFSNKSSCGKPSRIAKVFCAVLWILRPSLPRTWMGDFIR